MEELESEMEKFLPNIGRKHTVEDLTDDYAKINRKGQSSSEYDDEDDDDFGDEDDELLENDGLKSSLSSNKGRNCVKVGVMKPQDKRNYSKNISSLNSSKNSNETNFSEAMECPKEIDIIVADCQLRDGNVVHEATNELTGDFLENNIQISEKRQRLSVTGSDDNTFALDIYSSSSDDFPELHSIECEEALHKSGINEKHSDETKLSELTSTGNTERQQLHHDVVIKEIKNGVKPVSRNTNDLLVLEYGKQSSLEGETDILKHYTGFTPRHDDKLLTTINASNVVNVDDSSDSHLEEAAEQLQKLHLGSHEYQAYIGEANETVNIDAIQIGEQQSPIEKDGILSDRSDMITRSPDFNSVDSLKEHSQSIFKCDEFQDFIGKAYDLNDSNAGKYFETKTHFEEDAEIMDIPDSAKMSPTLELDNTPSGKRSSEYEKKHKLDIIKDDKFHDYVCSPILLTHGDTIEFAEQELPTEQIEIGKDFPYSANNSSVLPTTKSFQQRQQRLFGDNDFLDYVGSANLLTSKLGFINCIQIPEKDSPQSIENNIPTRVEPFRLHESEFAKSYVVLQKNEHSIDAGSLKSTNNNESSKGSMEFVCSAGDIEDCDTLRLHRKSITPPHVESRYLQSSDSPYSKEMTASRGTITGPMQYLQYDQVVSESLRNQLNRFDLLIDTIDQRNVRNMATNAAERGYWSTIFGQASEIEAYDEMSPERKAHRALELLEDYHSRLSEPQDRALRIAIERVIRIFKSRLFQALLAKAMWGLSVIAQI